MCNLKLKFSLKNQAQIFLRPQKPLAQISDIILITFKRENSYLDQIWKVERKTGKYHLRFRS